MPNNKKSFGRQERVAASIRREAADIINNEVKDPRVKFATVTEVNVSPDLKNARIYVSFLTDDEQAVKDAMAFTKSQRFCTLTISCTFKNALYA